MKTLCHYISEYMGVLVLAAAVLALAFPNVLQQVPTTVINYLLGVVMFGMGLTLNLRDFKIVFSRPKDVIVGCLAQFTIMPLLAWGLARAFQLDEALALGVVLVGCCPGGTASNVITYLAKGDLALSVGMTGVSTLLAPLLTPLLTWALAGKSVDVDVVGMLLSILWVVILPIVVGLTVKWLWPKFTERATDYLPAFSSVAIALIVAIIIAANASKLLAGGLVIVVVVILHNLCGLSLGYLIGRLLGLAEPKKRAISIEVGMQNSGLASSLATLHFAAYPMATIPGAIFSVWHNISGAIVARLYVRTDKFDHSMPKNMRKTLLMVAVAMMAAMSAQAQSNGYDTKHEVAISLGAWSNSQIIDVFENIGGGLVGATFENETFTGPISAEYFYHLKNWLGVGGILAYGQCKQDVYLLGDKDGVSKNTYLTLMPAVKFDWVREKHFGMYSKLAFGATLRNEKYESVNATSKDDSDSEVHVNWQASLLGIEAGGPTIRGFLELGTGEQGIALIGLRYKF